MKYELSEFNENGVSWPFSINQNSNLSELKKYFISRTSCQSFWKKTKS